MIWDVFSNEKLDQIVESAKIKNLPATIVQENMLLSQNIKDYIIYKKEQSRNFKFDPTSNNLTLMI